MKIEATSGQMITGVRARPSAIYVLAPAVRPWATAIAYFGMTVNFAIVWRKPRNART